LQHGRRRESEKGMNRDKKEVMVNNIGGKRTIKNTKFRNHKMFSVLVKVLDLFLRYPVLVNTYKSFVAVSPGH
jgi:hypothetical protein